MSKQNNSTIKGKRKGAGRVSPASKHASKRITTIADLIADPDNINQGSERGQEQLEWSLEKLGAWRSIAASSDGVVAAGNQTLERAAAQGLKIRPVHTKGNELVVVIRDDITSDDPRFRQYAIADNRISELNYTPDIERLCRAAQGVDVAALYSEGEIQMLRASLEAPDVEFKEYDESVEKEVKYLECPECGHRWPQ